MSENKKREVIEEKELGHVAGGTIVTLRDSMHFVYDQNTRQYVRDNDGKMICFATLKEAENFIDIYGNGVSKYHIRYGQEPD